MTRQERLSSIALWLSGAALAAGLLALAGHAVLSSRVSELKNAEPSFDPAPPRAEVAPVEDGHAVQRDEELAFELEALRARVAELEARPIPAPSAPQIDRDPEPAATPDSPATDPAGEAPQTPDGPPPEEIPDQTSQLEDSVRETVDLLGLPPAAARCVGDLWTQHELDRGGLGLTDDSRNEILMEMRAQLSRAEFERAAADLASMDPAWAQARARLGPLPGER